MKAQLLSATLFAAFAGVVSAADPQLLNLLPPDARVVAGVNVEQAKGTQFGQYVLNQVQSQDAEMQKLVALTGFDPRRDVREVLVASDGNAVSRIGLGLARGAFDVAKITAAAIAHGAITESYSGVTILEEPKGKDGIAFLDSTIVAAGDIASVKGAIDRQRIAQPLPAALLVKINQWSNAQDAWGISAVPPTSFFPVTKDAQPNPIMAATSSVQSAAGGVKFGANVVFTGEAVTDTAQNATTLGDLVKFMINLAQMQGPQNAEIKALANSVAVNASGTVLKISASLPQETFTKMLEPAKKNTPNLHAVPQTRR